MNYKTTVVLLVLVICAAVYFIGFDRSNPNNGSTATVTAAEGTPLFEAKDLSTEAVNKVVVERHGKTVTLEKSGTEWNQTAPVRFPINDWSARQVVDGLASLRASQTLTPDDKNRPALEKLGLAPPEAVVSLMTSGGKTFTVKLGRTAPGGRAYAMVGDDPNVYVVSDALEREATADDYNSWRRTKLTAPNEGQIERVTLTRGGSVVEMDKSDGRWTFGGANQGRVDRAAVEGLASAINDLYILKFVEDAPKDPSIYGLDKPATVLTLVMPVIKPTATTKPAASQPSAAQAQPVTHTLRIGAPTDLSGTSYFATWTTAAGSPGIGATDEVVFTIPKSAAEHFEKSVDDLRDPRITPVASREVKKLTIRRTGGGEISLMSTPNGWAFAPGSPWPYKADHDAASKLIDAITGAKAHAYLPAASNTGKPLGTITLDAQGQSEPERLALFDAPAEEGKPQVVVIRGRETVAYRLDADAWPVLKTTPLALRSKAVIETDPGAIRRVTLTRAGGPVYDFEATESPATQPDTQPATRPATAPAREAVWSLLGHKKFESGAFKDLLNRLTSLEATRWLESSPDLGKSPTTVVIVKTDGKLLTLRVNPATGAASLAGETNGFEIDQTLRDALAAEYLDRTVIPLASSDIERVKATNPKAKLPEVTLERDADGKFVSDEDEPIDQEAAGALFDTLGGLRVEHYFAKPPADAPGAAAIHLTVEHKDGKPIKLTIPVSTAAPAIVTMSGDHGERYFSISAETLKKLTAELGAKTSAPAEDHGAAGMGD
jgi:hypothetical protein